MSPIHNVALYAISSIVFCFFIKGFSGCLGTYRVNGKL